MYAAIAKRAQDDLEVRYARVLNSQIQISQLPPEAKAELVEAMNHKEEMNERSRKIKREYGEDVFREMGIRSTWTTSGKARLARATGSIVFEPIYMAISARFHVFDLNLKKAMIRRLKQTHLEELDPEIRAKATEVLAFDKNWPEIERRKIKELGEKEWLKRKYRAMWKTFRQVIYVTVRRYRLLIGVGAAFGFVVLVLEA